MKNMRRLDILYFSWTTRAQFENMWMSLVGVLGSTPSGNEMGNDNVRFLNSNSLYDFMKERHGSECSKRK